MIKVESKFIPGEDRLETHVAVLIPDYIPDKLVNCVLSKEVYALLKGLYQKDAHIVLNALERLAEEEKND